MLTRDQMEAHLTLQGWVPGVMWDVGVHHNQIGFVFMDSRPNSKTYGGILRDPRVHAVKPASWEQIEDWRLASIFAHLERRPYGDA